MKGNGSAADAGDATGAAASSVGRSARPRDGARLLKSRKAIGVRDGLGACGRASGQRMVSLESLTRSLTLTDESHGGG